MTPFACHEAVAWERHRGMSRLYRGVCLLGYIERGEVTGGWYWRAWRPQEFAETGREYTAAEARRRVEEAVGVRP